MTVISQAAHKPHINFSPTTDVSRGTLINVRCVSRHKVSRLSLMVSEAGT